MTNFSFYTNYFGSLFAYSFNLSKYNHILHCFKFRIAKNFDSILIAYQKYFMEIRIINQNTQKKIIMNNKLTLQLLCM